MAIKKKYQSYFKNIFEAAEEANIEPYTEKSKDWLYNNLKYLRTVRNRRRAITDEVLINRPRVFPGRVFMFGYNPKHAETLPYYDQFPLIIPIKTGKTSFTGINLHYLSPRDRAILFDHFRDQMLMETKSIFQTRFKNLSYKRLNSSLRFKYFLPAFKRYNYSHVKTRMYLVPPKYWEIALFLPTENFKKAEKRTVWRKSAREARSKI